MLNMVGFYPHFDRSPSKLLLDFGQMTYAELIGRELEPSNVADSGGLVVDVLAGCGGLALGFEAAGFQTVGYERDADACQSYRSNLHGECVQTELSAATVIDQAAEVIIGGPPCQPFSVGGLQEGRSDGRNGFPAFLSVVRQCQPKVALFENVKGILYQNKAYFREVLVELEASGYRVSHAVLDASDYGVPQRRERLFAVAHRGGWRWPAKSSRVYTAGEALGEMASSVPHGSRFLTPSMDEYVARYEAASKCVRPRDLHLDRPSRTVTCRNLNGATGDMLRVRLPDGRRRRLTVREGARLQSFPDTFAFAGGGGSQFNQIGNAVPPLLGKAVAVAVRDYLGRLNRGEVNAEAEEQGQLTFAYGD